MSTKHLRNILFKLYKDFLEAQGCVCNRISGGLEHWLRKGLQRLITIQSHIVQFLNLLLKMP